MTAPTILAPHLNHLNKAVVMVIGDVMLDRFQHGTVDRISPEAPVPVLRVQRETTSLGGAGNVVANLASLGAEPILVAIIGNDEAGAQIFEHIHRLSAVTNGLFQAADRPTTLKTRFLARNQQLLRCDVEAVQPMAVPLRQQLLDYALAQMDRVTAIILSDYAKGVLDAEFCQNIIQAARERHIPVVVDPAGRDWSRYHGATAVTPNRSELAAATDMATNQDDEIEAACWQVIDSCDIDAVVATRSEKGMSLVTKSGNHHHLPTVAREVWDVSGAGDTVIAVIGALIGVLQETDMAERLLLSAMLANVAGGIVVGKVGTAQVTPDELALELYRQDRVMERRSKRVSLEEAIDQVTKWRRQGLTVGFTNGCFDLIHPGHVSLMRQAKAQCDRLVMGLNSDDSVRRLKGPSRPVNSAEARSDVLAAMESIDLIVVFDEDTPMQLLESLRPDVLIKGGDYTVETVVGADLVQSYGGRVYLADITPGQSTTGTIARLENEKKIVNG
jgi:D-beta-D-heptose 7-phosphate kinase/D-beta-D-heptose 1-phosphate adenosyltransferase